MIKSVCAGLLVTVLVAVLPSRAHAQRNDAAEAYCAQIAAAEKSFRLNETRELRRWLDACESARRGWEWAHLSLLADSSARHIVTPYVPIRIEMSPEGDRVAVVEGSSVRILSWPSLEEIRVLDGHTDAVYRAVFSPDGGRLLTVARDVTSRCWDLASGEEVARIDLANPAIAAVAFSPDGRTAATCAWERDESGQVHGLVWIWDPATGEVMVRRRIGVKPLSSIAFLPDGSGLVAGSWDFVVHLLDTDANERIRFELPDEGIYNAVDDIAVSPDGSLVAAASKDRTVRVFATESGDLVASLRGHAGYVQGVSFSPDGAWLASCSIDTTVRLWNTRDWSLQHTLRGPKDTIRGTAWSKDGGAVVACSLDQGLWVWNTDASDDAATIIETRVDGIYTCEFAPNARDIAVACYDGRMRLFNSHTGELRREWTAHPESSCHTAEYSADGSRLVTGSWDKTARVWNPSDGSLIATLDTGGGVRSAAISPDGTHAATSGANLQVWDIDGVVRMHEIGVEGAKPARLAFSRDGNGLAVPWSDGVTRLYDVQTGEMNKAFEGAGTAVETVAFSPAGNVVITGDNAGVVRAFDTASGERIFETDTGGRAVNRVACSGNRVAVATDQLWILDLADGRIVFGTAPLTDTLWELDWDSRGERLALCSMGGVVKILETTNTEWPAHAGTGE